MTILPSHHRFGISKKTQDPDDGPDWNLKSNTSRTGVPTPSYPGRLTFGMLATVILGATVVFEISIVTPLSERVRKRGEKIFNFDRGAVCLGCKLEFALE